MFLCNAKPGELEVLMTAHLAGQRRRRRWQTWKCKHELTHMSLSVCVSECLCVLMRVCLCVRADVCVCVCMVNKHIWLHKALWLYLICTPQIGCCVCPKFFVARLTVEQGAEPRHAARGSTVTSSGWQGSVGGRLGCRGTGGWPSRARDQSPKN